MVRKLTPLYKEWEKTPGTVIIMKGIGEKAFCAGGDIRAIYDAGKLKQFGRGSLTSDFFYEEYNLNYLIAKQKVTQISLLNGITMGGGFGLSVHGKYRVATENTLFAMPETSIGFFPDVGASYVLPRLSGQLGLYLGLTGERLKGQELVIAGIATHFVLAEHLDELESKLSRASASQIDSILEKFNVKPDGKNVPEFVKAKQYIDETFDRASLLQAYEQLQEFSKDESNVIRKQWATKTLEVLKKMSPASLYVTFDQMKRCKDDLLTDYLECFEMEYNMSQKFVRRQDFYEGVRATLVDKDRNPKWNPSDITKPDYADFVRYFSEAPEKWKPF